jgi:hypothetical protein
MHYVSSSNISYNHVFYFILGLFWTYCKNFQEWMWTPIIVWDMASNFVGHSTRNIPVGHISWNLGNMYLLASRILQFVSWDFRNKMLKRVTCKLYWSSTFGCFDERIIYRVVLDNMDWNVVFELWRNTINQRFPSLD